MPQETHIKKNTHKIFLAIIFILVIGFGFGRGEKARADYCICSQTENASIGRPDLLFYLDKNDTYNSSSCRESCIGSNYFYTTTVVYAPDSVLGRTFTGFSSKGGALTASSGEVKPNTCKDVELTNPSSWLNCILLYVLGFLGSLLVVSATLFTWMIKPENITAVINNETIYQTWTIVRDVLNISFIMFLLFSAFATVFQIDKYSYKKTLLTIVIMALLVNFSFPIARFIIDVSNMMMYYFIDALKVSNRSADGNWFVSLTSGSNLDIILNTKSDDTSYLIGAVIFVFILAVTLLTIALLFVIRTIALAILIIFSSLAFIGAAIPPLSSYANDWWKKLFSYAFFGPIMIFMLYIATSMIGKMDSLSKANMIKIAGQQTSQPGLIAAYSFFAIPIIILWMGLGIAQSMSIHGAGAVVGKAQGFMGWVGKNLTVRPATAGIKAFDRNILGNWLHISPRQFMAGWKASTQEAEESKLAYGKGLWHDRINYLTSFGKQKTNNAEVARQSLALKKMKQVKDVSDEAPYLLDRLSGLVGSKSPESVAEIKAILRTIYGNNDQDELMDYIKNNIDGGTPIGEKFKKMGFDNTNYSVSERNVSNAALTFLKNSGADDDEINKELLDLGNIAAGKQGLGYGAVFYNQNSRKFERIVGNKDFEGRQGFLTASKMMTIGEAQNIPKSMHRNNFTDQNKNLNESGKALLRKYASPTAIKHIERHKPDFYKSLCIDDGGEISNQMLKYAAKLKSGADGWDENFVNSDGSKGAFTNGTTYTDGTSGGITDLNQALNAAGWTVALKIKSGVSSGKINAELSSAGFTALEIPKILAIASGTPIP